MYLFDKVGHILESHRDRKEIQHWISSLTPLGVAFVFFFIFLLPMDIPHKDVVFVTGAGAGFAGLQSYWVFRGWQREEGLTIFLGIASIALVGIFVWSYPGSLGDFIREVIRGWAI